MKIKVTTPQGDYYIEATAITIEGHQPTGVITARQAAKRLGGMTSAKKATASRINGLKGGRPKQS